MPKNIKIAKNYETYSADGRIPLEKLYRAFLSLPEKDWDRKVIYTEIVKLSNGQKVDAPILSFSTKIKGPALWLISGIHGEEPAGPNALARSSAIRNYRIPVVLLPLCNPKGYRQNWRYLDKRRGESGKSVGDSEHLLLNSVNVTVNKPRRKLPNSLQAGALTKEVLRLSKTHPPLLTIDFHEDELVKGEHYMYSQGKDGFADPVVKEIVRIFQENDLKFMKDGKRWFGKNIKDGIIHGVHDGSIDELLSAEKIFLNGKITKKPAAKSVIVIETPIKNSPIEKRVKTMELVIKSLKDFWKIRSCN
ncbi:MAG: hypothetical protein Q7S78_00235 [Candidatus Azambacteria bacterium]|nr:hypothetical protein [Candidatus Azambacteria bacterium]